MNPTQQQTRTAPEPVRPQVVSPATCVCGQDLDVCSGQHCTRCGTQLGPMRLEAAGFWQAA